MSPQWLWSRCSLNQCTHDSVSSSSWSTSSHTAGASGPRTHSALYNPLVVSARALSKLSATVPIEGRAPISSRRSVKRTDVNCDPASEWATSPTSRRAPLERLAISSASRTISVRMFAATRQPTIMRPKASTMKHT